MRTALVRNTFVTTQRYYAKQSVAEAVAAKNSYLTKDEVSRRLITLLQQHPRINKKNVKPESHFLIDLGLEEDDTPELITQIEQEFAIEIPGTLV